MKTNKKVIGSVVVAILTIALAFTAAFTNDTAEVPSENDSLALATSEKNLTAGVAGVFNTLEVHTTEELEEMVSIDLSETQRVSVSLEEATTAEDEEPMLTIEEETEAGNVTDDAVEDAVEATSVEQEAEASVEEVSVNTLSEEEMEWMDSLITDISVALNVRAEGSEEAELVGKLYPGDRATVVEQGIEWSKITSGNVEGYVKNSYCVFGLDALAYAKENCEIVAVSKTNGLRVRKEQNTESDIITTIGEGEQLSVDKGAAVTAGWVAVRYNSNTYYVSSEYVSLTIKTGKGVTIAEIEAAQKAAEEEAAKKAAASGQRSSNGTKSGKSLAAEADEVTLLAALIQCEVGGLSYDCHLAVGAVVVNRVKSGLYPDSVYDVIYQKGQFTPASSGALDKVLKKGPSKTAKKAAEAALDGDDNTEGAKYFKLKSSGQSGVAIDSVVFY